MAPIYGLAAAIPDKTIVHDMLRQVIDIYYKTYAEIVSRGNVICRHAAGRKPARSGRPEIVDRPIGNGIQPPRR